MCVLSCNYGHIRLLKAVSKCYFQRAGVLVPAATGQLPCVAFLGG